MARVRTDATTSSLFKTAQRIADVYGISKVTRDRVAKEAGVSTGLISHYFGSMDALLDLLYEERDKRP